MRTKHSWNTVPKNWEKLGHPPSDTAINLYVALKPRRGNALIDTLYGVSNPGHPRYRAHLSKEQVTELVAPHPHTLELVNSWLEHHGVPPSSVSVTHGGNTRKLTNMTVTQANALLGASYELYRHVRTNEIIVRTVGHALSAALHGHVLTVAPTTSFASPPTHWQTPRNRSTAGLMKSASGEPATMLSNRDDVEDVTPSFLHSLYDIYNYKPTGMGQNMLGIMGILEDYPSPTDLARFMIRYRSEAEDATFTVVKVNGGGYDPSRPHEEANLNIQYAESMAYPTPHTFYSTGRGPEGTDEWFFSWLDYILDEPIIPQTISISYAYYENAISREYTAFVCELFGQLGLRGVSVLIASGDHSVGVGGCVADDGSVRFMPEFPATCPWVTVVGGTTGYEPEVAAVFSGGGFSDHFLRPSYQEQAVSTFTQHLGDKYKGLYNASGRGIPDISAQAIGFQSVVNGKRKDLSGTSGSAPVVAGIISLLNDYLLSRGRAPLGFLNPWLYGIGLIGLDDITEGSNPGCNTDGFSAIAGWDPVTGLGTPKFYTML